MKNNKRFIKFCVSVPKKLKATRPSSLDDIYGPLKIKFEKGSSQFHGNPIFNFMQKGFTFLMTKIQALDTLKILKTTMEKRI